MVNKFILFPIVLFLCLICLNVGSAATNVTNCTTLNTENGIYTLNQSISSSFDCLIINATNITLNCAGYNITFGNSSGGWGISVDDEETYDGYNNVTIKNCRIFQNQSGASGGAIYFGSSSENGIVYNNTLLTYGGGAYGIAFDDYSVNANISLNNITTSESVSHGIYIGTEGNNASIKGNNITTYGSTASGIVISDDSTNATIFDNKIVTYGDRNLLGMGGIFLEIGTSGMNVSSNNITTFGIDGAGIWAWGSIWGSNSNSTIENNIITTSGAVGDGVYLDTVQGINLTSNTITLLGNTGDGIHSVMSENYPLIFYNNTITTSGNYSYGINLNQDSNNNISSNNIATSGDSSHGIFFNQSHNAILANNIIATGESNSYVLYLITSANETVYNNIFNTSTSGSGVYIETSSLSYFNTTNTTATNIIGKLYIGGNFWTNNASTGFSDNCIDSDGDYFCDSFYQIVDTIDIFDYLPLTNRNNILSACGTLNITERTYYLNQSINANGACFNITANNVTLDFDGFNITGNTSGAGINITAYNNTKILNGLIYNFSNGIFLNNSQNNNITNMTLGNNSWGIYIDSSPSNTFTSVNISNSSQDAVLLEGATSDSNNFTTVVVADTNASCYGINFSTADIDGTWFIDSYITSYTFAGAGGIVNFKVSGSAMIELLEPINGSGTDLTLGDFNVESNLLFVNSSGNSGLNKSANITFYGITYTDPKPQYSSDGVTFTDCTATTDPACSELSFSGNVFKFNTTHFTYFRSAEAYVAPSSSPGGGGSSYSFWSVTYVINDSQFKQGYTKELAVKSRIQVNINNSNHYIGVVELTSVAAKINVSSSPQQATFLEGDIRRFDTTGDGYYDVAITLNGIVNSKANVTILSISEKVTEETEKGEQDKEKIATGGEVEEEEPIKEKVELWKTLLIITAVIIALILIGYIIPKKK